jgi:hypothetical protein
VHIQQTREDGTMVTSGFGHCLANLMSNVKPGFWYRIGPHPAGQTGYVHQYFDRVENDDLRLLRDIAYSSPLQAEVKTSCGIFFFNYKVNNISSYWFCFNRGRNVEVSANAFKNSIGEFAFDIVRELQTQSFHYTLPYHEVAVSLSQRNTVGKTPVGESNEDLTKGIIDILRNLKLASPDIYDSVISEIAVEKTKDILRKELRTAEVLKAKALSDRRVLQITTTTTTNNNTNNNNNNNNEHDDDDDDTRVDTPLFKDAEEALSWIIGEVCGKADGDTDVKTFVESKEKEHPVLFELLFGALCSESRKEFIESRPNLPHRLKLKNDTIMSLKHRAALFIGFICKSRQPCSFSYLCSLMGVVAHLGGTKQWIVQSLCSMGLSNGVTWSRIACKKLAILYKSVVLRQLAKDCHMKWAALKADNHAMKQKTERSELGAGSLRVKVTSCMRAEMVDATPTGDIVYPIVGPYTPGTVIEYVSFHFNERAHTADPAYYLICDTLSTEFLPRASIPLCTLPSSGLGRGFPMEQLMENFSGHETYIHIAALYGEFFYPDGVLPECATCAAGTFSDHDNEGDTNFWLAKQKISSKFYNAKTWPYKHSYTFVKNFVDRNVQLCAPMHYEKHGEEGLWYSCLPCITADLTSFYGLLKYEKEGKMSRETVEDKMGALTIPDLLAIIKESQGTEYNADEYTGKKKKEVLATVMDLISDKTIAEVFDAPETEETEEEHQAALRLLDRIHIVIRELREEMTTLLLKAIQVEAGKERQQLLEEVLVTLNYVRESHKLAFEDPLLSSIYATVVKWSFHENSSEVNLNPIDDIQEATLKLDKANTLSFGKLQNMMTQYFLSFDSARSGYVQDIIQHYSATEDKKTATETERQFLHRVSTLNKGFLNWWKFFDNELRLVVEPFRKLYDGDIKPLLDALLPLALRLAAFGRLKIVGNIITFLHTLIYLRDHNSNVFKDVCLLARVLMCDLIQELQNALLGHICYSAVNQSDEFIKERSLLTRVLMSLRHTLKSFTINKSEVNTNDMTHEPERRHKASTARKYAAGVIQIQQKLGRDLQLVLKKDEKMKCLMTDIPITNVETVGYAIFAKQIFSVYQHLEGNELFKKAKTMTRESLCKEITINNAWLEQNMPNYVSEVIPKFDSKSLSFWNDLYLKVSLAREQLETKLKDDMDRITEVDMGDTMEE